MEEKKNIIDFAFVGREFESIMVVEDMHLAMNVGSGDLPVLATPVMVSLMENAAMNCIAPLLPKGYTTVGGHIETSHLAPSKPGAKVSAKAVLAAVSGKKLTFEVFAFEGDKLLGKGTHLRFAVDAVKFMQ